MIDFKEQLKAKAESIVNSKPEVEEEVEEEVEVRSEVDLSAIPTMEDLFSFEQLRKGVTCPCCDKWMKINRRRVTKTMIQYLEVFYVERRRAIKGSRVKIKARADSSVGVDQNIQTGDYKRLEKWGLVRVDGEEVQITQLGIDFVEGRATVPEAAFIENNKDKFLEFDGDAQVTFKEAAGRSFDISEVKGTYRVED